ncbi:uncharacterized protein [Hetaerina americana]|uniref:uncharacterized protein n=1 Tax=Hetaerina americana TaxID=62018 RepID=UPI003A7F1589
MDNYRKGNKPMINPLTIKSHVDCDLLSELLHRKRTLISPNKPVFNSKQSSEVETEAAKSIVSVKTIESSPGSSETPYGRNGYHEGVHEIQSGITPSSKVEDTPNKDTFTNGKEGRSSQIANTSQEKNLRTTTYNKQESVYQDRGASFDDVGVADIKGRDVKRESNAHLSKKNTNLGHQITSGASDWKINGEHYNVEDAKGFEIKVKPSSNEKDNHSLRRDLDDPFTEDDSSDNKEYTWHPYHHKYDKQTNDKGQYWLIEPGNYRLYLREYVNKRNEGDSHVNEISSEKERLNQGAEDYDKHEKSYSSIKTKHPGQGALYKVLKKEKLLEVDEKHDNHGPHSSHKKNSSGRSHSEEKHGLLDKEKGKKLKNTLSEEEHEAKFRNVEKYSKYNGNHGQPRGFKNQKHLRKYDPYDLGLSEKEKEQILAWYFGHYNYYENEEFMVPGKASLYEELDSQSETSEGYTVEHDKDDERKASKVEASYKEFEDLVQDKKRLETYKESSRMWESHEEDSYIPKKEREFKEWSPEKFWSEWFKYQQSTKEGKHYDDSGEYYNAPQDNKYYKKDRSREGERKGKERGEGEKYLQDYHFNKEKSGKHSHQTKYASKSKKSGKPVKEYESHEYCECYKIKKRKGSEKAKSNGVHEKQESTWEKDYYHETPLFYKSRKTEKHTSVEKHRAMNRKSGKHEKTHNSHSDVEKRKKYKGSGEVSYHDNIAYPLYHRSYSRNSKKEKELHKHETLGKHKKISGEHYDRYSSHEERKSVDHPKGKVSKTKKSNGEDNKHGKHSGTLGRSKGGGKVPFKVEVNRANAAKDGKENMQHADGYAKSGSGHQGQSKSGAQILPITPLYTHSHTDNWNENHPKVFEDEINGAAVQDHQHFLNHHQESGNNQIVPASARYQVMNQFQQQHQANQMQQSGNYPAVPMSSQHEAADQMPEQLGDFQPPLSSNYQQHGNWQYQQSSSNEMVPMYAQYSPTYANNKFQRRSLFPYVFQIPMYLIPHSHNHQSYQNQPPPNYPGIQVGQNVVASQPFAARPAPYFINGIDRYNNQLKYYVTA